MAYNVSAATLIAEASLNATPAVQSTISAVEQLPGRSISKLQAHSPPKKRSHAASRHCVQGQPMLKHKHSKDTCSTAASTPRLHDFLLYKALLYAKAFYNLHCGGPRLHRAIELSTEYVCEAVSRCCNRQHLGDDEPVALIQSHIAMSELITFSYRPFVQPLRAGECQAGPTQCIALCTRICT